MFPAPVPVTVPTLITKSETMDLQAKAYAFEFSTSDLFDSVLTISLGLNVVLTVLLGAMHSMNIQFDGAVS